MNRLPKNTNWKRFFEYNYYHRLVEFHFLRLIPYYRQTAKEVDRTEINHWVRSLDDYQKIIVVGSGPSVKQLEFSSDYIYHNQRWYQSLS